MQDVQNRQDKRGIAIQKVGIKEAHLPFLIKTKEGGYQQVLARVRFTVALPSQYKGTHMSRFLEILMPWSKKPLAETEMEAMLSEALERLEAHSAEVELSFKYFVDKVAPVSRRTSVLDFDCCFTGRKEQGKPMEEVAQWILDHRMHSHAWLTVGDLKYLARGGRISPTSAVFGTILDIKPIICMGRGGKMDAVEKVRGHKKTLRTIVERTAENIEHPEDQTLILLHGDVPEEAEELAAMLRARIPTLKDIRIQIVGPVIGCHCGPGTLASVFMGKERPI